MSGIGGQEYAEMLAAQKGYATGSDVSNARMLERAYGPKWIACSERLPGEGAEVLVAGRYGLCVAQRCPRGWRSDNETYDFAPDNLITHWMPLPDPPEGT